MKIRKLELEGYKVFDTLELDFTDPEDNTLDTVVLAGVNGCGKTSLLDLLEAIFSIEEKEPSDEIRDIYQAVEGAIEMAMSYSSHYISESESLVGDPYSYFTYRIGSELIKGCTKLIIYWDGDKHTNVFNNSHWDMSPLYNVVKKTKFFYVKTNFLNDPKIEQDVAKYIVDSVINEVTQRREIPSGVVIQETIDKINNMFDGMDMKTKLVDITATEPIFESFNGKKISINQLSSGEKQLFCQAAYLQKLNLQDSIILIDEPETSLHPTWQRNILKLYQNIGENNQIIVATHSPHVIASVKPESLFVLYPNPETGKIEPINMAKAHRHTKGVEPNRILQEIMGLDDLRDPETRQQIDEIAELLRLHPEQVDLPENQAKIEKLRDELGNGDPFIIRMEHQLLLIKRKKQSQ